MKYYPARSVGARWAQTSSYIAESIMTYRAAGAANKSQLRRREEENNPLTIGLL